jgi:hypothetical protein
LKITNAILIVLSYVQELKGDFDEMTSNTEKLSEQFLEEERYIKNRAENTLIQT